MLKLELTVFGQVQKFNYRLQVFNFIEQHYPNSLGFIQNNRDGSITLIVCEELESLKKIRDFAINQAHNISVRTTEETISSISSEQLKAYKAFKVNES